MLAVEGPGDAGCAERPGDAGCGRGLVMLAVGGACRLWEGPGDAGCGRGLVILKN